MMSADQRTTVDLAAELVHVLDELSVIYGSRKRVIHAAVWLFASASDPLRNRALIEVAALVEGRDLAKLEGAQLHDYLAALVAGTKAALPQPQFRQPGPQSRRRKKG